MRLAHDAFGRRRERREPPPAIAAAIGHEAVQRQVVPAVGEGLPIAGGLGA